MNKGESTFGMDTSNAAYSSDKTSKSKSTLEIIREREDVEGALSTLFRKSLEKDDSQSTLDIQANQTMLWGMNVLLSELESAETKANGTLHRRMDMIRSIVRIRGGYDDEDHESLKEMERELISPHKRIIPREKTQKHLSKVAKRALTKEASRDKDLHVKYIDTATFIGVMNARSMKKAAADAQLSQAVDKVLRKLFQSKATQRPPSNTPSSSYIISSPLNKKEKPIKASWKNNAKIFDEYKDDSCAENERMQFDKKPKWKGKHVVKFRRMTNLYL